jgi:hypothetical protein
MDKKRFYAALACLFVVSNSDAFYSLDFFGINFFPFETFNFFKKIFPYHLVECPCVVLRFFEYPLASFFQLLTNIFSVVFIISVICSPLILFHLFKDQSKDFKFRLYFFIFLVYESIFLILYFTTRIFENNLILTLVWSIFLPILCFVFYKIYFYWVINRK